MSAFVIEKGAPGFTVSRDIDKLGYKTVETCELHFDDFPVPAASLIGGVEGHGFKHAMTGLESERISVAARGWAWRGRRSRRPSNIHSSASPSESQSANTSRFKSSWPIWPPR